jgi:hypothetical protein
MRGSAVVNETPLEYAGETSTYAGTVNLASAGAYTLEVLAMQPEEANLGHVERPLTVGR